MAASPAGRAAHSLMQGNIIFNPFGGADKVLAGESTRKENVKKKVANAIMQLLPYGGLCEQLRQGSHPKGLPPLIFKGCVAQGCAKDWAGSELNLKVI